MVVTELELISLPLTPLLVQEVMGRKTKMQCVYVFVPT